MLGQVASRPKESVRKAAGPFALNGWSIAEFKIAAYVASQLFWVGKSWGIGAAAPFAFVDGGVVRPGLGVILLDGIV